jgi:hypothetical protein
VSYADPFTVDENANDVEAIRLQRPAVPVDPNPSRTRQLLLFSPVDRFDGISELAAAARLDLDEGHETLPFDDEIDVPMPVAEPALDDAPTLPPEPPFRDPFPELPECLPGC